MFRCCFNILCYLCFNLLQFRDNTRFWVLLWLCSYCPWESTDNLKHVKRPKYFKNPEVQKEIPSKPSDYNTKNASMLKIYNTLGEPLPSHHHNQTNVNMRTPLRQARPVISHSLLLTTPSLTLIRIKIWITKSVEGCPPLNRFKYSLSNKFHYNALKTCLRKTFTFF